jgi:hypothetical protein
VTIRGEALDAIDKWPPAREVWGHQKAAPVIAEAVS